MKWVILILLMASFVSAGCIDINSASLEELDEIVWVGPATAQKIIDARPFDNIEDLDKVGGIGEVKVSDIKEEGLACVDGEFSEEFKEEPEEINEVVEDDELKEIILLDNDVPEIISLNGDVVEKIDELVYVSKDGKIVNWLPYGLALFLIFIIGILLWERF